MPPLRTAKDIISRAQQLAKDQGPFSVAVPAAADDAVIDAVKAASDAGFARAYLIGDTAKIEALCDELKVERSAVDIIHCTDDVECARIACRLAADGKAGVIMKGNMPTGKLLKTVLSREYGFRTGRVLSHLAVMSMPNLPRLIGITDGGMVVVPDEVTRLQITQNAIDVFHALDVPMPNVALLAATDDVIPGVPITRDLAAFAKACERGLIKDAIVDGPLAFDSAVWPRITDRLGFNSKVAGSADIVITGSIEAGNIIVKSLDLLADAVFAGVITGAKIPIALVSRSDTARNKLTSLALTCVVAAAQRRAAA